MSELRNEALSFDAFIPILHLYMKRNKLVTKGAGSDPIGVLIAIGMPHWTVNIKRKNTDAVKTKYVSFLQIIVKKNRYSFQDFQIDKVGLD